MPPRPRVEADVGPADFSSAVLGRLDDLVVQLGAELAALGVGDRDHRGLAELDLHRDRVDPRPAPIRLGP